MRQRTTSTAEDGAPCPRLLVVHSSAEMYGSDRAALEISRAAVTHGLEVGILLPENGPLVDACRAIGVTVYVGHSLVVRRADLRFRRLPGTILRGIQALSWLYRFSRIERFDLVHSNCAPTLGGTYLSRLWRVPHVWHVHETLPKGRLVHTFYERLLLQADIIVACSRSVRMQFRRSAVRAKCRVAYTGADVPSGLIETIPLARNEVEIICVGRFNQWKGQTVAIQALAKMRSLGHQVRLTLVGDVFRGEDRYRERLADLILMLGMKEHVTLTGERRDALKLVAQADIAIVPSVRPEPFGMALVEAMALGRPVVASDQGGPFEIIQHGIDGLLVSAGSSDALADAIISLIDEPAFARSLGERARQRARQFRSDGMTKVVLGAYSELINLRMAGAARLQLG